MLSPTQSLEIPSLLVLITPSRGPTLLVPLSLWFSLTVILVTFSQSPLSPPTLTTLVNTPGAPQRISQPAAPTRSESPTTATQTTSTTLIDSSMTLRPLLPQPSAPLPPLVPPPLPQPAAPSPPNPSPPLRVRPAASPALLPPLKPSLPRLSALPHLPEDPPPARLLPPRPLTALHQALPAPPSPAHWLSSWQFSPLLFSFTKLSESFPDPAMIMSASPMHFPSVSRVSCQHFFGFPYIFWHFQNIISFFYLLMFGSTQKPKKNYFFCRYT
ncbi:hypothetical protein ABW19_dt0202633 [Dactylella cylindrospora]|nr:hypothetical protein ABW19_dt0202633 [Dactylella cylindrospora]